MGQSEGLVSMIIVLVLLFAVLYFFMIRPQQRQRKEHDKLVDAIRKGDKVVTASGIYGQIESISQDVVILKIESGATMKVARSSISGKVSK